MIIEEIPVEYKYVQEKVPYKWPEADFVVHVGVSSAANDITIEECAKNCGYTRNAWITLDNTFLLISSYYFLVIWRLNF